MRWKLKAKPNSQKIEELSKVLEIENTLAKLLLQRDIKTFEEAKEFFKPDIEKIHNPFLMKDMDKAVARIEKAIDKGENIMIYGDYDVDGTTSVALLSSYLSGYHQRITNYIPNRHTEGYGISFQGIDFAKGKEISLIIALDCGIKAIEKVNYASKKGIDFIICDHHKPGSEIPKAIAVLNPKREDCNYPYDELCGCGVGFKLIHALSKNRKQKFEELRPYLDLVAVAIAADIVPITGENRILAFHGLKVINSNPREGIKSLINISNLKKKELMITDIVFNIAPRLNAPGRIKDGLESVELMMETNFEKAEKIANTIEVYNSERKELDKQITKEALLQIRENREEENRASVVFHENWDKGVVGIVASKLIEKYHRPTLVFTKSGDKLVGSARSIRTFDIYKALEQCSEFIEQFGGHKYAAGITLKPENYQKFKDKFEKVVRRTLPQEFIDPEIQIDAELFLSEINPKFLRILKRMSPFGPDNMTPVFMTKGIRDNGFGRRVGKDESHLKLEIISGTDNKTYNAIGFGLGEKLSLIENGVSLKAAFTIGENYYNGICSLQLLLKDIKEE